MRILLSGQWKRTHCNTKLTSNIEHCDTARIPLSVSPPQPLTLRAFKLSLLAPPHNCISTLSLSCWQPLRFTVCNLSNAASVVASVSFGNGAVGRVSDANAGNSDGNVAKSVGGGAGAGRLFD